MKTPYKNKKRGCNYLHNISDDDTEKFIEIANISDGMFVLDAMCGDGAVGRLISKNNKINLILLDNSEFQIMQAKNSIKNAQFINTDILKTGLENNSLDRVFIRNGIYELPKKDQRKLYEEVYRILKKNGKFLTWIPLLNNKTQKVFQKITNLKDSLAGFENLVKNRYLPTKEELEIGLRNAGFNIVDHNQLKMNYTFSTKKWGEIDFNNDPSKIEIFKDYINDLKSIEGIDIRILGDDIHIIVPALITISTK